VIRACQSRLLRRVLFAIVAAGGGPLIAAAQSELVIYKEGTQQYHRPGCDVIRDGKDVLALTRAQAEARGYKPHPDCDPAQRKLDEAPAAAKAASAEPQTVYLNGTRYYHRKECKRLEANPKAVHAESLDAAGKTYWPCPDCRPPVRKRTPASQPPGRVR
jgi:hypothetical protein